MSISIAAQPDKSLRVARAGLSGEHPRIGPAVRLRGSSHPHLPGLPSPVMATPLGGPVSATSMAARDSAGGRREHGRGPRGVCDARLAAERHGNLSVACAGTPPGAEPGAAVLPERQGGVPASG
jgi:hypothetical protein